MDKVLLDEKTLLHLQYLAEILDFGAEQLKTKVVDDNKTYTQNFLIYSFSPVHNFSEAIYCLCKDSRPHAAQVLLRSIFEACVNIEYALSAETEKRLALFAKDSFKVRSGMVTELEGFVKKYPNLVEKSKILGKENLESIKSFVSKEINAINLGNGLNDKDLYPKHLIERIRQLDREVTADKKGMYELNYHIMYRQLSLFTHLNSWGLELFVNKGPQSIEFTLGQDPKDVDMVVGQTYMYYYGLLEDLYKYKIFPGEVPENFKKRYNELRQSS